METLGFLNRAWIVFALCVASAISSAGQTFTTLHNFSGTDGSSPQAGLVQGTDGNFYGTTSYGGTDASCSEGCGTIFQITPAGTLSTLQSFDSANGETPLAPLIQGTNGQFYGTTYAGGLRNSGTIFSIAPGGTLVTLYSFCSQASCADGSGPVGGLILGTDGNFYGTTSGDAQPNTCSGNCGTVFKITPAGTLTTLYTFDGTGGYGPAAGLVQGTDGNFYGTTALGGNDQIFGVARPKGTHRGRRIFGMLGLSLLAAALPSCGGGGGSKQGLMGTPAGTSTVTVTASTSGSGAVNHTASLTINVTQ